MLYDQTNKIKMNFASLVFDLQKNMEEDSNFDDVVNLLIFYDKSYETLLCGCTKLNQVFRKISKFSSFFDFELMKFLIDKLGSSTLKQKSADYIESFQVFSKRRVCECPRNDFSDDVEESDKVYVLKTDKIIEELTVEELKKLQYEMNKILGNKLKQVVRVEDGCVTLMIRTFGDVSFDITKEQLQALRKFGVRCISFGDQYFDTSASFSIETETTSGVIIVGVALIPTNKLVGNFLLSR